MDQSTNLNKLMLFRARPTVFDERDALHVALAAT